MLAVRNVFSHLEPGFAGAESRRTFGHFALTSRCAISAATTSATVLQWNFEDHMYSSDPTVEGEDVVLVCGYTKGLRNQRAVSALLNVPGESAVLSEVVLQPRA